MKRQALRSTKELAAKCELVSVSDAAEFGVGNVVSGAEIGARNTIVPSELVFVPL